MIRRNFLASLLALPAGLFAAAKAAQAPRPKTRVLMDTVWFQTTRLSYSTTLEYEDTIYGIFEHDMLKRRLAWHDLRKARCRDRLAGLRAEPVHQLP